MRKNSYLCRNSKDGLHHRGPTDGEGRFFCIHCGKPLYILEPKKDDDNVAKSSALSCIVGNVVFWVVVAAVGLAVLHYFWA